MKSKQEVIQEAWGETIYHGLDVDIKSWDEGERWYEDWKETGKVYRNFLNDNNKRLIDLRYDVINVNGWFWPKSLSLIETNNGWQETGYHHCSGVKLIKSPFENGQYYEIGFMSAHSDSFHHQGVKQYNNGFFDENNYHLKPFPTHFRIVKLSDNPLY